jgi:hypothetical protein
MSSIPPPSEQPTGIAYRLNRLKRRIHSFRIPLGAKGNTYTHTYIYTRTFYCDSSSRLIDYLFEECLTNTKNWQFTFVCAILFFFSVLILWLSTNIGRGFMYVVYVGTPVVIGIATMNWVKSEEYRNRVRHSLLEVQLWYTPLCESLHVIYLNLLLKCYFSTHAYDNLSWTLI